MEYFGDRRFNLASFRHTDKWWELSRGLTLGQSIEAIRDRAIFLPA